MKEPGLQAMDVSAFNLLYASPAALHHWDGYARTIGSANENGVDEVRSPPVENILEWQLAYSREVKRLLNPPNAL